MVTHSSVFAWRIPRTEEPGGLKSMESQGVRHNWATQQHTHTHTQTQATKLGLYSYKMKTARVQQYKKCCYDHKVSHLGKQIRQGHDFLSFFHLNLMLEKHLFVLLLFFYYYIFYYLFFLLLLITSISKNQSISLMSIIFPVTK